MRRAANWAAALSMFVAVPPAAAGALAAGTAQAANSQAAGTAQAANSQAAQAATADTVTLGELHAAALQHDARARQAVLNESALELRLRNLESEWLPALRLHGEARYQSDVPTIEPSGTPAGGQGSLEFPVVPKERYEMAIGVEQTIYDGGSIAGRRDLERARNAEAQAHLTSTLYALRLDVTRAYFSALVLAARTEEVLLMVQDLNARLEQTAARVKAGVALPGEAAAVEAELLRARQRVAELRADRRAALSVLNGLTGAELDEDARLPLPDLADSVAYIAAARDTDTAAEFRRHPAFAAFRRTAERLEQEAELAGLSRRPRVVAFGEAGYGRPGLNQFGDAWDTYWLGGVRVEWAPWRWGAIGRERDILDLRRETVQTEMAAFADELDRAVADELEDIARLRAALATDERIVHLRERIEREASRQFEEGVLLAADYIDTRTDLLAARLNRRLHRIQLAEMQARYLTTLGVPIP